MQITFKEIDPSIADLAEIISPSIGNPTKETIQNILESYGLSTLFWTNSYAHF